jgi:hypothetical protein
MPDRLGKVALPPGEAIVERLVPAPARVQEVPVRIVTLRERTEKLADIAASACGYLGCGAGIDADAQWGHDPANVRS